MNRVSLIISALVAAGLMTKNGMYLKEKEPPKNKHNLTDEEKDLILNMSQKEKKLFFKNRKS